MRIHLFEIEDQSWCPDFVRKGITDYLHFAADRMDFFKSIVPILKKCLLNSGQSSINDLCSGGGGATLKMYEHLIAEGIPVKITLTDKYPNLKAFDELSRKTGQSIGYVSESIDARKVPAHLNGLRTLFVSFHHFKPADAIGILENASKNGHSIAIFEMTERTFVNFVLMLFSPVVSLISAPFIKPFSWNRIIFNFFIPLIPIALTWDGLVSVLRTYSVKEMHQMVSGLKVDHYHWEIGSVKTRYGANVLYLLGYPIHKSV